LIVASYGFYVSVSTRLDQLLHESFVADLGYPADQSMVARVVLGLQLLADEIDALATRINQDRLSSVVPDHGKGESENGSAQARPEQSPMADPDAPAATITHDSPIGVE
jgi:hypothetical protein